MDIASVLNKYELDLSTVMTPEGLVSLRSAFSDLLDTLTADSETQQNREKEIRDNLKRSVDVSAVRLALSEIVSAESEDVLVSLVEAVQEIKQDLMVLRDFHVSAIARENKPEKAVDSDEVAIRKDEAATLKEAINSVFSLMGRPTDIADFPTKTNKEGVTLADLPRIPIGNSTGSVRGRGAKVRQLCFEVNGEAITPGTLFYDVVKTLCDFGSGFVIKPNEVKDLIDESGQDFAPEGYANKWTVTVGETVLSGWLPADK